MIIPLDNVKGRFAAYHKGESKMLRGVSLPTIKANSNGLKATVSPFFIKGIEYNEKTN